MTWLKTYCCGNTLQPINCPFKTLNHAMQRKRYKLLLAALILSAPAGAQSLGPSELNAAGNSATAGGNTYEYAIGSVVGLPAYSSASIVVTPGVLQPQSPTGIHT